MADMKISDADILLIPDLGNTGPGHWQRRWEQKMRTSQWVEQNNWKAPLRDTWVDTVEQAVLHATRPVVLVGHSLGVITIVHAAQKLTDTKVCGAFLVTPLDIDENREVPRKALPFANVPTAPLPFPSILVASDNDPYCTTERAGDMANAWGSEFHAAQESGRFDLESGHGPWPDGMMMFMRLMQRI